MKIGVDLDNSPPVLLFEPLIRQWPLRGHEVTATVRVFAQTVEGAENLGLNFIPLGR